MSDYENLMNRLTNAEANIPAVAVTSQADKKKKSQYWLYPAFITDMQKLKEHDLTGIAYIFEMGSPVDDLKEKMEKMTRNESLNEAIELKNDFRLDVIDAMADLEPGEWKVLVPNNPDPQESDCCFMVRRLDAEKQTVNIEEALKTRKRKSFTF